MERLEEQGRCDLDVGHDLPHLLVNVDHDIYWKATWPIEDDDADVVRYLAIAGAYEDEDNRRMAARGQE
jgi:hypothetical protein